MTWRIDDPQGNEAAKVRFEIVQYTRGHVLDLGCGPHKAFPHFIGVDSCKDTELFGIQMRPDLVIPDCASLQEHIQDQSCDAIFSSHLLEHIEATRAALASWWQCIKVGGHLVLYLPHRDLYPNIGQFGANPDHKHDFVPQDILAALEGITNGVSGFDVLVNETRDQDCEYSFLLVIKKLAAPHNGPYSYVEPKPEKTACVVRYGGFGDMIQAANILPALKREGYHVTVMTTPKGQDVLKADPHVDAWFIQDNDQVPNGELHEFWKVQARHYDRFIQLSESVEGTLLAMPGRANHAWPDSVRRRCLGKNYLEWTSELAEVSYASEGRFYSTTDEAAWARGVIADLKNGPGPHTTMRRIPERFNILWCLSGSSLHKFYPHQDAVIKRVLDTMPEAAVILAGDEACQILEAGWERWPSVLCTSGKFSIRQTLTLAQHVQCVVGPETGVLNAVAFEPMGKVVMLSHSSPENLTKHWVNTETMVPRGVSCYPCHRLHYGKEFCREVPETGAAACADAISPDRVYQCIRGHYDHWRLAQALPVADSASARTPQRAAA